MREFFTRLLRALLRLVGRGSKRTVLPPPTSPIRTPGFFKLERFAQRRANNTGRAQYIVRCSTTGKVKIKVFPQRTVARDETLRVVWPDAEERAALLNRRKTRGGNRVRVGSNVR